jgi:bifunctional UDP-N-acetylglucosamine pyrophosphorylase/glucosamine-1-phosphate N-acetyltransferase
MIFELDKETRLLVLARHRENGVEIPLEDGVIIGPEVKIGAGTLILPGTILRGSTVIGENCEIGPNSYITDSEIGAGCRVISTYIELSVLESDVKIGPMSNVRPNCRVMSGAKIGDFVELKNANIGEGTSVAHLTYIGDSDVGARCNFGCGVVTVNYDGSTKSRTTIGDGVFVGCNTNLIAPVKMGDGSYSAAGTTVTGDIPEDALVIGRARQEVKEGRAKGRYKKR